MIFYNGKYVDFEDNVELNLNLTETLSCTGACYQERISLTLIGKKGNKINKILQGFSFIKEDEYYINLEHVKDNERIINKNEIVLSDIKNKIKKYLYKIKDSIVTRAKGLIYGQYEDFE